MRRDLIKSCFTCIKADIFKEAFTEDMVGVEYWDCVLSMEGNIGHLVHHVINLIFVLSAIRLEWDMNAALVFVVIKGTPLLYLKIQQPVQQKLSTVWSGSVCKVQTGHHWTM